MRTTVSLDDDVLQLIRRYADSRSLGLGKAVCELVRRGLTTQRPTRTLNGLQVFDLPPDSPPVSSKKIREAKTNLSKLIEQACRGEEVIIARGATPVVRLVPIGEVRGRRQPGVLRGKLRVGPEFFEPLPAVELSAWE
jgi:prevent-host-death family protein